MPVYRPWDHIWQLPLEFRLDKQLKAEKSVFALHNSHGFESEESAFAEDEKRSKRLLASTRYGSGWTSNAFARGKQQIRNWVTGNGWDFPTTPADEAIPLSDKLRLSFTTGRNQQTLASSYTFRQARIGWAGATLELFSAYADADLKTFTIMHPAWVVPAADLESVTAQSLIAKLRADLRTIKLGAIPGPLVAWIHCEFDPITKVFIFHFHGMTTETKAIALQKGLGRNLGYVKTRSGASAIRTVRIFDRVRQVSYLMKSFWPQKAFREVSPGKFKRDRKGSRIIEPYGSMALLWLHRHQPTDVAFRHGCRFMPNGQLRATDVGNDDDENGA